MTIHELNIEQLQRNSFDVGDTSAKMPISDVFTSSNYHSPHEDFQMFVAHFNTLPNLIELSWIDCDKATKWLAKTFQHEIKDMYYSAHNTYSKHIVVENVFYFLFDDLLLSFNCTWSKVRLLYRNTPYSQIMEFTDMLHKFKQRQKRLPKISLVTIDSDGLATKSMHITKPTLQLHDNYNDDFKNIHQTILKRLSKKNDKGLVLLHGKPGTGKTSYIRYLATSLKKKIIFLPPNMAAHITSPQLMPILIDNPNSVFVIEDAENIVIDREKEGASPVSALLNLADGLLSDCLNIQIICSFNTDISKVDNALIRKGRLIAKYEFNELEIQKAQLLSNKLGFTTRITQPMTLTEIYNQQERDFTKSNIQRKRIGFQVMEEVPSLSNIESPF